MKMLKLAAAALGAMVLYLLAWPTGMDPRPWTPKPIRGEFPVNERLRPIERLAAGQGRGPEGIAIDGQGRVHAGFVDGRVVRLSPDGSAVEELFNTGGRPLGLAFTPTGQLLVADGRRGLLRWDGARLDVLADTVEGQRLNFVDDVDVSSDGRRAYFSDASSKFALGTELKDFLEHGANGSLLEHDLETGRTRILLRGLHFANGVAVGPDDAYVLVTETSEYRIRRYWLKGERAGTDELFIDGLPGFPDNVTFDDAGTFWVALYAPRTAELDGLLSGSGWLRQVSARLPRGLQPAPVLHAFALGLDLDGKVVANLQHAGADAYAPITSVRRAGAELYFGSLSYPAIGRLSLPAPG